MGSVRARNWLFTLRDPAVGLDIAQCLGSILYAVYQFQLDCTDSTPYVYGYVEFPIHCTRATVESLLPTALWELATGTRAELYVLCTNPRKRMLGTLPIVLAERVPVLSQFELRELSLMMTSGASLKQMYYAHPRLFFFCFHSIMRYRFTYGPRRDWIMNVTVIWGSPGVGKTTWVKVQYPDAFWKTTSWWDGYDSEDTVVLDYFDGHAFGCTSVVDMVQLMGSFPLAVNVRGGQVWMLAKNLVIVSRTPPSKWYDAVVPPEIVAGISQIYYCCRVSDNSGMILVEEDKREYFPLSNKFNSIC